MTGAKLKAWHSIRAKERQLAALQTSGKRDGKVKADSPERDAGQARDHAAKAVGVGGKLIDQAENVMRMSGNHAEAWAVGAGPAAGPAPAAPAVPAGGAGAAR
jgi:hypothetical protein